MMPLDTLGGKCKDAAVFVAPLNGHNYEVLQWFVCRFACHLSLPLADPSLTDIAHHARMSVPQMLRYRKAIADFQAAASHRANSQLESSLQVELLRRIASSQRGLASDHVDRAAILDLIQRLESVQAGLMVTATAAAELEADAAVETESMEGEWHLEYASSTSDNVGGWDFAGASESEKMERVSLQYTDIKEMHRARFCDPLKTFPRCFVTVWASRNMNANQHRGWNMNSGM